jgi:hypothetical protein
MKCEYAHCYAKAVIKISYFKTGKTLNVCLRHAREVINDIEDIEGGYVHPNQTRCMKCEYYEVDNEGWGHCLKLGWIEKKVHYTFSRKCLLFKRKENKLKEMAVKE